MNKKQSLNAIEEQIKKHLRSVQADSNSLGEQIKEAEKLLADLNEKKARKDKSAEILVQGLDGIRQVHSGVVQCGVVDGFSDPWVS